MGGLTAMLKYALAVCLLGTLLACDAEAQLFRRFGGGGGGCGNGCGGGGCGQSSQGCNIAPIQAARQNDLLQAPMAPQGAPATSTPAATAPDPATETLKAMKALDAVAGTFRRAKPLTLDGQSALQFVSAPASRPQPMLQLVGTPVARSGPLFASK